VALGLTTLLVWTVPLPGQTPPASGKAAVIPIRGEITDVLRDSIERRLEQARADGATTIIFEMDTPGGMVTSALDICAMIKNLPSDVRSVAWVHHQAYSAGAMISLACNQILMSSASKFGDCTPIMMGPAGGVEEMSERITAKAESPVLQEFRDSAQRNGYDLLLCRAMVKVDEEVWWLEHIETNERKFVNGEQKQKLFDEVEEDQRRYRLVEGFTDYLGEKKPVEQPIDRTDSVLTLSQSEAIAFGFARGIATNFDDLAEQLDLSSLPVYHQISGWEKFAMWLNSPLVRGVLFMIMIIGAYIEYQSPGLIIPGAIALIALVIFLGAPYVAGLANIWTIVLLVLGLILLAIEIFLIPGFGIAGILGIALILVAFIGTFVPAEPEMPTFSWPTMEGTKDAIKTGVIVLSSSLVIAVIGIMLLARYLPELPGVRRAVLGGPEGAALALEDPYPGIALVGDVGVVVGDLKPGGTARFGTEVVDVQSQGEYVDAGGRVQVLKREGRNIIVRPLPDEA
jgi:membrane-bound serine protease (ClpP class)